MTQTNNNSTLSKKQVIAELWHRGNLSWKLKVNQKEMYNLYKESQYKVHTWLLSRRSGKSYTLCLLAVEACLKTPNSVVKFLSPTKTQVNMNLRPIMRDILSDCPNEIKPDYKEKDYIYYFPNGSEIQLAGSESGHADKLRGGSSVISIVDEAQDVTDLENIVKSILLPTTATTNGKIILSGTPPANPDHEFIKFIEQAEVRGTLTKKTIDDNPMLSEEQKIELIEEGGGINSEYVQREYYCKLIADPTKSVVPEFTKDLELEIIKEWPKPPFFDCYDSMDLGGQDLTVVLFAYYDFRADKVVIEDEISMDFTEKNNTIDKLTKDIELKENLLWTNTISGEKRNPLKRVSDINLIVTQEIAKYSQNRIIFSNTAKDNKEAAISNTRLLIGNKKIIINPRCQTLIRHLRNVKWANNDRKTFSRSPDNGHYDAVDALIYLIRNIDFRKNPYPAYYELNLRKQDAFFEKDPKSPKVIPQVQRGSTYDTVFSKIFNIRKR